MYLIPSQSINGERNFKWEWVVMRHMLYHYHGKREEEGGRELCQAGGWP